MQPQETDLTNGVVGFHGRISSLPLRVAQCAYNEAQDKNYFNLFLSTGTALGEIEKIEYKEDESALITALAVWNRWQAVTLEGVLTVNKDKNRTGKLTVKIISPTGAVVGEYAATGVFCTLIPG